MNVLGSSADAERVARALDLPFDSADPAPPFVIVARTAEDVGAVRAAVSGGSAIACVIALELPEENAVTLYDAGVAVAFGHCDRASFDAAIAAGPDPAARRVAARLAALEHALDAR